MSPSDDLIYSIILSYTLRLSHEAMVIFQTIYRRDQVSFLIFFTPLISADGNHVSNRSH